jgi:SOS-response transcriptional repressor LexA
MIAMGLTAKQLACKKFIAAEIARTGVSPSFEEIDKGLNLGSKGRVARFVKILIERGHLTALPGRHRSLAIVADPRCPHCGGPAPAQPKTITTLPMISLAKLNGAPA